MSLDGLGPGSTPHTVRRAWLSLLMVAALAGGGLGCEPGEPDDAGSASAHQESLERFHFLRSSHAVLRLDSSTGQMWLVPYGGQGGWTPLGAAPTLAGIPGSNGRFEAFNLELKRRGMEAEPVPRVLRLDGATGRTWTIEVLDGAKWVQIDEPAAGSPQVADTSSGDGPPAPPPIAGDSSEPMTADQLGVVPRETLEEDPTAASDLAANLVQALEKEGMPAELQAWSARQLGQFPPEVAVPPLLRALESEHPAVVVAAIHALKETGDPSTIPMIQKLARHPDPSVRAAVAEVVVEVD